MNNKILLFAAALMVMAGAFIIIADSEEDDATSVTLNAMTVFESGTYSYSYASGTQITLEDDAVDEAEYNWQGGSSSFTLTSSTTRTIQFLVSGSLEDSVTVTFSVSSPSSYSVSISSSNNQYGTVSTGSVTVVSGTTWSVSGNTLNFSDGQSVTATTQTDTAQYDYSFTGWSPSSGTVNGSGTSITANFSRSANYYTVSIGVNQSGWGSVSNSSVYVPYGTSISSSGSTLTIGSNTIYAYPASSDTSYTYSFSSWTGASGTVTGSGKTVTANFSRTAVSYTIHAEIDDNSAGTVTLQNLTKGTSSTGTGISLAANYGDQVRYTATMATGYTFSNWYDINGSADLTSDNPYTTTVSGNMSLAAITIAPIQTYTVSFTAGTGGSVSSGSIPNIPSGASINVSGNTVTINGSTVTATADAGYTFSSWSNATGNVTAARTITANFTQNTYTIHAEIDDNSAGTVTLENVTKGTSDTGTDISVTANYGDQVRYTATMATGYTFSHWYDIDGSADLTSDNPYTTTVSGNMSLAALTATSTYTVFFTAGTGGAVSSGSIANIPYNTPIFVSGNTVTINGSTITANASTGYAFDSWSNATGNVTAARTITANFTLVSYTIKAEIDNNTAGTVTLENVTKGTSDTGTDISVTANYGDQLRFTATMNAGYTFSNWYNVPLGMDYPSDNPYTANAYGNMELAAITIAPIPTYTVYFTANTGGSVSSDSLANIPSGASINVSGNTVTINGSTVTATAAAGYTFSSWSNTAGTITEPRTITANFTQNTYTIHAEIDYNYAGVVTVENITQGTTNTGTDFSITANYGDQLRFSATVNPAYSFSHWYDIDGSADLTSDNPYTTTVSGNMSLAAITTGPPAPSGYAYWSNGQYNGAVSILFKLPSGSISHTMTLDLMEPTVTNNITTWTDSGYDLTITLTSPSPSITATLIGNGITPITKTVSLGSWSAFQLDIDIYSGLITATPVQIFNSFTDFTLYEKQTKTILDFTGIEENYSVDVIRHYSNGTSEARFSVVSTEVFLDTYGVILYNPSINLYSYFPQFDAIRANFYSFALYGESITINNTTYNLNGSKVTVQYVSDGQHNYLPSVMPNETVKTKTMDLSNIYVTFDNNTGHVELTFVDDRFTIDLGAFQPSQWTISMQGVWFFTMMVYEPYTATEKTLSDWKMMPELSAAQMILIFMGLLVVCTAAFAIHSGRKGLGFISILIIAAAGIAAYILLG